MLGIVPTIYKGKKFVEGHTFESNKQTIEVKDQFNLTIDEIGLDGSVNQQTIVAYAENENLIHKLDKLKMYQQVDFIVDINYYKGQLNKIVVLDILDSETDKKSVDNIFRSYTK